MAAEATFTWNGGTGLASDPANWTMTGVPQSNDDIVIGSGDATNAGIVEALNGGSLLIQSGNSGASFTNLGAVVTDGGNIARAP